MAKKTNLIAAAGCMVLTLAATLLGTLTGDTLTFLLIALMGMAGTVLFFKKFTTADERPTSRITSDVVLREARAEEMYRTITLEFHED